MNTFHIPDMSCGHCKTIVEKAIKGLDPEAQINFDMETRRIALGSVVDTAIVQAALAEAGYPATPI
ncbi:heavy-metal-associated domain-containing protein [Yoonia vestfoldensis]|uniref:Heavy metal transport/detoxification protein n=1 Tax=Yoonia vestfoldensis SKA53 TaxID=314232 RepID=A3V8V0_9RHOB|nr:heavy-metal-associated domain-containing protein [Yoonia vestfoldensis]EAQ05313.1 Heavy metal transport/detoxification protein [Yoonia vestfoldensis SKA53]